MLAGPYRVGPWPGLSPSGAAILLGCAVLMAVGLLLVGGPNKALPDLPLLAAVTILPMAIAGRIVKAPGAASAVCGAYLMPRTLLSLARPDVELPPLLLVPAIAFDLTLWLRRSDVVRSRRRRIDRLMTPIRASVAGAVFGLVLALVEPPFAIVRGADPTLFSNRDLWIATALSAAVCSGLALVSVPGRASSPPAAPTPPPPPTAGGRGTAGLRVRR